MYISWRTKMLWNNDCFWNDIIKYPYFSTPLPYKDTFHDQFQMEKIMSLNFFSLFPFNHICRRKKILKMLTLKKSAEKIWLFSRFYLGFWHFLLKEPQPDSTLSEHVHYIKPIYYSYTVYQEFPFSRSLQVTSVGSQFVCHRRDVSVPSFRERGLHT